MNNLPNIPPDFQTFVETIAGDANAEMTFQTFGEKNKARFSAKIIHSRTDKVYSRLKQLNDKGHGIFMMINKGDLKGRSAQNVIEVRAVFADFDETPYDPDNISLPPHLVVESSSGKHHVYWLVSGCSVDQFKPIQKAIAAKFGSDSSVHDICRVMRVPGFNHQKGDPFLTHIADRNEKSAYPLQQIVEGLGLDLSAVKATSRKGHDHQIVFGGPDSYCLIEPTTGDVLIDLQKWAKRCPDFLVADALHYHKADVLLGPPRDNKQHIRCPFNNEHTDEGDDNATFCINGSDPKEDNTGFVIHCRHAHCDDRDRLDYVRKMLELGWLPLESLKDKKYLAERRRPKWVHYDLDYWIRSPEFSILNPREQGVFLHYQHICWCHGEGKYKDNDWLLARHLGLALDEWRELRSTYIHSGLLKAENGYLVNDHILDTYEDSRQAYEAQVRSGREGGKSKTSA